jgi:hypothetical protein
MIRISVRFENHSRTFSTTEMHKSLANLFCTLTPNTCYLLYGTFFILMLRWRETVCVTYNSVKFSNLWFTRYGTVCCNHHSVLLVKRHLLSLSKRKQQIYDMFYFISYKTFWLILSVKISKNRNNMKVKCTEFDVSIL